jgi:hypothetical protein
MAQISKEQIEAQIQHLRRYHIDNSASGLTAFDIQITMLQGLLDQPEQKAKLFLRERGQLEQEWCELKKLKAAYTHPEDDGSDWFYKLKFICRVLEGASPDKTDMQTALGMARSLKRERWTAEKVPRPITADDVTDEMVQKFKNARSDCGWWGDESGATIVCEAVNAYMGAKK